MGMYSERLATTISAQLIEWRLRENGAVEGTIYNSTDAEYNDGELIVFMNTHLTHFRYTEGFWPDHFIMSTNTGKYFMLKDTDRYVEKPMA